MITRKYLGRYFIIAGMQTVMFLCNQSKKPEERRDCEAKVNRGGWPGGSVG